MYLGVELRVTFNSDKTLLFIMHSCQLQFNIKMSQKLQFYINFLDKNVVEKKKLFSFYRRGVGLPPPKKNKNKIALVCA